MAAALRTVALVRTLPDADLEALARQVAGTRSSRHAVTFLHDQRGDGLCVLVQGPAGDALGHH